MHPPVSGHSLAPGPNAETDTGVPASSQASVFLVFSGQIPRSRETVLNTENWWWPQRRWAGEGNRSAGTESAPVSMSTRDASLLRTRKLHGPVR